LKELKKNCKKKIVPKIIEGKLKEHREIISNERVK
jgi:hypothetical protein